jgi:polyhydroxybutyrate depolymerase
MITDALPWIGAGLIFLKVSIAAWIAARLYAGRLLSGHVIVTAAVCWIAIVLAFHSLLAFVITNPLFPPYLPALIAILSIPLARLAAAPLALAWNRHRSASGAVLKSILRGVLVIGLPVLSLMVASVVYYFVNRTNGAIISSNQKREYYLHVPASYDRSKPAPLVISLHGGGAWPASQMNTSRWNQLADTQGFIVVYPAGSGRPRSWHVDRGAGRTRDVQFISKLIDTLEEEYSIDPTRIYVNGLSNGAGMTFVLSCELSDRIAAVGMVAAAHSLPWSWCADHHPVPMIAFHGSADSLTPYTGGRSPVFPFSIILPSIPEWTASWASRNRCQMNPIQSRAAADVVRLDYTTCADDASVVLYTVLGGGHTWPGGKPFPEWLAGHTTNNIDATNLMWEFFRAHPLSIEPGAKVQ